MIIWVIGLSGSGKTTLAALIADALKREAPNTVFLDGDEVRAIFQHEGAEAYTLEGRKRNADRICALCRWLDQQDINVVCAVLSLFEDSRDWNRKNLSKYFEVFVDVPIDVAKRRDAKGLYAAALRGEQKNVVGVDIPFTPPRNPDYTFNNSADGADLKKVAREIVARARRT